jgi:hypothetical protein
MTILYLLLALNAAPFSHQDSTTIPSWAIGKWEGSVGWDGDTLMYSITVDIQNNNDSSSIVWQGGNHRSVLRVVYANEKAIRFQTQATPPPNTQDGIFEIFRPADAPDTILFVQFFPAESDQFWLGKLQRIVK